MNTCPCNIFTLYPRCYGFAESSKLRGIVTLNARSGGA
jgi:hypothetical protein